MESVCCVSLVGYWSVMDEISKIIIQLTIRFGRFGCRQIRLKIYVQQGLGFSFGVLFNIRHMHYTLLAHTLYSL